MALFISFDSEVDDRGELGLFAKSKPGGFKNIVYGPYNKYPPGGYEVVFELVTEKAFVSDGRSLCVTSVASASAQQIVRSLVLNSSAVVGAQVNLAAADRPASPLRPASGRLHCISRATPRKTGKCFIFTL